MLSALRVGTAVAAERPTQRRQPFCVQLGEPGERLVAPVGRQTQHRLQKIGGERAAVGLGVAAQALDQDARVDPALGMRRRRQRRQRAMAFEVVGKLPQTPVEEAHRSAYLPPEGIARMPPAAFEPGQHQIAQAVRRAGQDEATRVGKRAGVHPPDQRLRARREVGRPLVEQAGNAVDDALDFVG